MSHPLKSLSLLLLGVSFSSCLHNIHRTNPVSDCFLYSLIIVRIVSTYLVHHGYCATAEAFAKSTGQSFTEELASIKNRQSEPTVMQDRPLKYAC